MTGRWPSSLELLSAGLLLSIPVDPLGQPYKLMPEGHFAVSDPAARLFIQKGYRAAYN
jgi:hypothetical protein